MVSSVKEEEIKQEKPARTGAVQPDSPGSDPDWDGEEEGRPTCR